MNAESIDVWTDVVVPLVAAFTGGAFALLGARWGARWAAGYQNEQATAIARKLRREERREEALLRLDVVLTQLEAEADNLVRQADDAPHQFSSDWSRQLSSHLSTFFREWNRLGPQLRGVVARKALSSFDPIARMSLMEEARQRREQTNDPAEAQQLTRDLLADTRELRAAIHRNLWWGSGMLRSRVVKREDEDEPRADL